MDGAKVGTYAARWLCAGEAVVEHEWMDGWMDGWAWAAGMHFDLCLRMTRSCFALPQPVWTCTNNHCVFCRLCFLKVDPTVSQTNAFLSLSFLSQPLHTEVCSVFICTWVTIVVALLAAWLKGWQCQLSDCCPELCEPSDELPWNSSWAPEDEPYLLWWSPDLTSYIYIFCCCCFYDLS